MICPRFSPVGPIALLEDLQTERLLGNYLLLLAHDIIAHAERYEKLVSTVRFQGGKETFIILDNSMMELGCSMSTNELQTAHSIVRPNCTILPDILEDGMRTVKYSVQSSDAMAKSGLAPFMAVPQGKSLPEISWCAQQLSLISGVEYWGVPRAIANRFGTRRIMMNVLGFGREAGYRITLQQNIHLLGMSNYIADDLHCMVMPGIMGLDSANPLVLGQQGYRLSQELRHTTRGDFWNETRLTQETRDNIHFVRNYCSHI